MNNLNEPTYVNVDVFTTANNCPNNRVSYFRVYEGSNSPYGSDPNDFFYYVNKLESNDYIRMLAFDIRSKNVYTITKLGGSWGSWNYQLNSTYGLVGGIKFSQAHTVEELLTELGVYGADGQGKGGICGGSVSIETSTLGVPVTWYHWIWIPHQDGKIGDSAKYFKLILMPFWNYGDITYVISGYRNDNEPNRVHVEWARRYSADNIPIKSTAIVYISENITLNPSGLSYTMQSKGVFKCHFVKYRNGNTIKLYRNNIEVDACPNYSNGTISGILSCFVDVNDVITIASDGDFGNFLILKTYVQIIDK